MRRAAKELENKNNQIKRARLANKDKETALVGGLSTVGGAAAAAWIDSKYGDGNRAEIKGIPTNAAVGAGLLTVAMIGGPKLPGSAILGHAGLGMVSAVTYSMLLEKFEEGED